MPHVILNRHSLFSEKEKGDLGFRLLFRKGVAETLFFLASKGSAGYSEIKRQGYMVGDRSLSRILKELQEHDLITRTVFSTSPISTEYSLTDKGRAVAILLNQLKSSLGEG